MLIGGDDISNDIITLGTCFSIFVYIITQFCFMLIGGNQTAQLTGSLKRIGGAGIPESLLAGYNSVCYPVSEKRLSFMTLIRFIFPTELSYFSS